MLGLDPFTLLYAETGVPMKPDAKKKYSDAFGKFSAGNGASGSDPEGAIRLYDEATALFKQGDALQG